MDEKEKRKLEKARQEPKHPDVQYEQRDIHLPAILFVLTVIAFCFVLVASFSWYILHQYETPADRRMQATYTTPEEPLPAEPILEPLQPQRRTDPFAQQLKMEQELHSYGKVQEEGYVHIPIEEAIKVAVSKLPVRKDAEQSSSKNHGLVSGGEPNSGRLFKEPPQWFNE